MEEKTLNETLLEQGRYCSTTDPKPGSYRRVFPNSEQVICVEVNALKKRGDLFLEDLCGFFV
jgi:hypothetical protein